MWGPALERPILLPPARRLCVATCLPLCLCLCLCLCLQVDDFHKWLSGKQEEQAKLAAHEDPAFKAEEVTSWLMRLQKVGGRWVACVDVQL